MSDRFFIDSNILVYTFFSNDAPFKSAIGKKLLLKYALISPQVIFECINVARKKLKLPPSIYLQIVRSIIDTCEVVEENALVVETAINLLEKYSLQPFDAKIVATALHHDCNILYSEDMQHDLLIDNKLKIINPFLNK